MAKYYYDCHIHTSLSPCADVLMSPNNILNMAMLKGLDIIAITDHNSTKQLASFMPLLSSYDLIVIPGVEIETKERFHIVGYFPSMTVAMTFGAAIEGLLDRTKTAAAGSQDLFDVDDNIIANYPVSLHQSLPLTYIETIGLIHRFQGIAMIAHIERYLDRFIGVYPAILDLLDLVEINLATDATSIIEKLPLLKMVKILRNSDAHDIERIAEPLMSIELPKKTVAGFVAWGKRHD